jgi:heptosyltransferase-3
MRWDARKYVELLSWLWQTHGIATVMARPATMTKESFEETILAGLPEGAGTLITGTTVEDLIALIAEASLVLGSDGGPIHIAAGLQRPVVAIFSATDVDAWSPWQAPSRIVRNPWPCAPCPADRCYAHAQPECILSVEVEPVRRAVAELLGR